MRAITFFTYVGICLSTSFSFLQAQITANPPADNSMQQLTYRELRDRLHQHPTSPRGTNPSARPRQAVVTRQPALSPQAVGGAPSSFAGFYAAQVLPGLAPVSTALDYYNRAAFLTADFNHDGHADLLTIDDRGSMAVALGDGQGHFATPIITAPVNFGGALSAFTADINGDGYPDVIVTTESSTLAVFTNQRNGAFSQTATLTLANAPVLSAQNPMDFRNIATGVGITGHSGAQDIVVEYGVPIPGPPTVSGLGPSTVTTLYRTVFFNDGTGGFSNASQSASSISVATPYALNPGQLTLADVNGDGKADLITPAVNAQNTQLVDVALGNGDGTFQQPASHAAVTLPVPPFPYTQLPPVVLLGSLTRDVKQLSLLVASSDNLYAAASNGDGTFKAPVPPAQPGAGAFVRITLLQLADVNGDGSPDLLVCVGGSLAAYLGKGDGTFAPAASSVVTNDNNRNFPGVALADFDGDGKLDFIAAGSISADVAFGKGLGGGSFAATPLLNATSTTTQPLIFYVDTATDLNGDGRTDILGANQLDGTLISGIAGNGGAFTYKVALPASTTVYTYLEPVTGDFNGDGKPDLVVTQHTVGATPPWSVGVALSNGDGTLQAPVTILMPNALGMFVAYNAFAVADVNGDGKQDIVFVYIGDPPPNYPNPPGTPPGYFVALGKGDGTFSQAIFTPFGIYPTNVALGSFHGKSAPLDLVIADEGLGSVPQVAFFQGAGDGTFRTPTVLTSTVRPFGLLTEDFNKDGNLDLLVSDPFDEFADASKGGLFEYLGRGDGSFSAPINIDPAGDPGLAVAADVNGDGNLDIVFDSAGSNAPGSIAPGLAVLLGNGDGTFGPSIDYPLAYGALPFAGNFLGDNTQSILAGSGQGTAFFMNQGGTSVTLASAPPSPISGQATTITAQVTPTLAGLPVPTGTGTFLDGTATLGDAALSGGVASLSLPPLTPGAHTLSFRYGGDANFQPNSGTASLTVATTAVPDFTVTANTTTLTFGRGQSVSTQVTISANAGLSGTLSFACSGLPLEAACSFAPATVAATPGQAASTTLTITTKAPTVAALEAPATSPVGQAIALLGLMLLLPSFPKARKRWMGLSMLAGCLTFVIGMAGCGSSSSARGPSADPGSPAGTSTITVTVTATTGSTSISHSLPITLVVQ